MPVITDENPEQVALLQWGLIPGWVKEAESALSIKKYGLNARCETIFEKPMFRHSIRSKRCLVLVSGFFEWRHYNSERYPYYIRLKDNEPFALAGIWDVWHNHKNKQDVSSFSIITTTANPLMAKIHNTEMRMPVILKRQDEKTWLDRSLTEPEIESYLTPYDQGEIEAYPIDRGVAKVGFNTNDPAILDKKEYPELPSL